MAIMTIKKRSEKSLPPDPDTTAVERSAVSAGGVSGSDG